MKPAYVNPAEIRPLLCGMPAFSELSAEILHAGKALRFRAHGASMQPLVRDGDVLLVRPLEKKPPTVGEIVLCRLPSGSLVAHRIIQKTSGPNGNCVIIQGDAVSIPDGEIALADVYGLVCGIERGNRCINTHRPLVRILGWLAAYRSRHQIGRGGRLHYGRQIIKRLPILSTYLS